MKKLGTPIGAGPGSESEKVGFDGVGTPLWFDDLPVFNFDFDLGLGLGLCGFGFLCWWLRGFAADGSFADGSWALAGPLGCGGPGDGAVVVELVEVEVDVELGVVVEVDVEVGVDVVEVDVVEVEVVDEVEELEVVVVVLDVLVLEDGESVVAEVVVGVVAVTPGRQLSVSDAITPDTGSVSEDIGVSGGASMTNVNVSPPTMIAVIVHESAAAAGNPTVDIAASIAPASALTTNSFRLLDTTAYLLLPFRVRSPMAAAGRRRKKTLLAASEVCKS
jgi:hypothetical protein